ncbi:MAG: hypothetical protein ABW082_14290 [Sedimenticola sp.]
MDLEVIGRVLAGIRPLHGYSNTILGATVVLVITVLLGKPLCEWVLKWWNRNLSAAQAKWLKVEETISIPSAWAGGLLGIYFHWIFDGMMHADARPFAPFSIKNPFIGLVSLDGINYLCLISLAIGAIIYIFLKRKYL